MNQRLTILIFILSGFFTSCHQVGGKLQDDLPKAYFEGTYKFSEFESMTIGTWFFSDSACLLFKRKDADNEFIASSGFVRKSKDLYAFDAGNEGRLVFRYVNHQIEVLTNEGEPINRNSKFLLSRTGNYPDSMHVFSSNVWFSESDPGFIAFCTSGIRMKYQKNQTDTIREISGKAFQAQLSVLPDEGIQSPELQIIHIVQELNLENCK